MMGFLKIDQGPFRPYSIIMTIFIFMMSCDPIGVGLRGGGEIIFQGEYIADRFGTSLDFIGDIDGDGDTDIAVGAPYNDTAGTDAGMVYIYFGPFDNTMTSRDPDLRIAGRALSRFGTSIAGGFDFNNDGLSDFVVSSAKSLYGSVNNGDVFVFLGSPTAYALTGIKDAVEFASAYAKTPDLFGLLNIRAFGRVVGLLGDVDRDGIPDLGIGAPDSDYSANSSAGALFLFLGRTVGIGGEIDSTIADYTIVGGSGENLGYSFDYALNLDGQSGGVPFNDDFLIGGPKANRAHVFLGPVTKNPVGIISTAYSDRTLQGGSGDEDFGFSVTHLKDIDGDGIDDIAVSYSNGRLQGAYIFYGRQGDAPLPDLYSKIEGSSLTESGAGYISSFDEVGGNLLIGAPLGGLGGYEFGSVYIFVHDRLEKFPKGGTYPASVFESSKIISNPINLGDSGFASILSSDGDASGDGLEDLLIGAPLGDMNGEDSGYALLEF